jgi:antitoxin YefM
MTTTSLADAKDRLSELIKSVQETHERFVITKDGKPAVVLISVEDLESLEETLEILSDPKLVAAIRKGRAAPAQCPPRSVPRRLRDRADGCLRQHHSRRPPRRCLSLTCLAVDLETGCPRTDLHRLHPLAPSQVVSTLIP